MIDAPRPPRGSRWLLGRLLHPEDREPAIADLDEEFESRAVRDGVRSARAWYRLQVRRSWWPAFVRRFGRRMQMPSLASDLRWAWRGLRSRGAAALLPVLLVALAVAAATIVFAAADAFVLRPAPYPNADRLVVFQRDSIVGLIESLSSTEAQTWRARTDLFRRLYPHTMAAAMFITAGGVTESVRVGSVSPGLFEALGVVPRWGRPLLPQDVGSEPVAVIAETLARRLAGDPSSAIDRQIENQGTRFRIVGVMPSAFRFPTALEQVWIALDESRLGANVSASYVGELAPTATIAAAVAAVHAASSQAPRSPSLGPVRAVALPRAQKDARAYTNSGAFTPSGSAQLLTMLLAMAVCMALLACLSVGGLQIVTAMRRAHTYRVLAALGATRGSLTRAIVLEAGLVTGAAVAAGLALANAGAAVVTASLPAPLAAILANAIDVDRRAATFLAAMAALAAAAIGTPLLVPVAQAVTPGVGLDSSRAAGGRWSTAFRQSLLGTQVALSMFLLVMAVLFVRTYVSLVGEAKGFDDVDLVAVQVSRPRNAPGDAAERERALLAAWRDHPGVVDAARTGRLLPGVRGGAAAPVWIEGQSAPAGTAALTSFSVDPNYCAVMRLHVLAGRCPAAGDTDRQVVVDHAFARRFWPAGDAVGARFSTGVSASQPNEIVGVVARVRLDSASTPMRGTREGAGAPDRGDEWFVVHRAMAAGTPALAYVVRLRAPSAFAEVAAIARAAFPGSVVRVETMAARYAESYGDMRMAAGAATGFGVVAGVVTLAGLYAVVAHLVATRTREIGIRMALGAGRRDIRRLVFAPAARGIAAGLVAGSGMAVAGARLIESRLHGVSWTAPSLYAVVAAGIAVTAFLATRPPVRQALRIDPADTLRSE